MDALGALDRAIEFGRAGRQHEQLQPALLASVFKGGGEFATAIDLQDAEREGHALLQGVEKAGSRRGGGPAVGIDHVPARDHLASGELLEHHARHRAHLQGVDLDQIAGLLDAPAGGLADGIKPRPGTGARRTIPIRSRLQQRPAPLQPRQDASDHHGNTLPQSVTNHSEREQAAPEEVRAILVGRPKARELQASGPCRLGRPRAGVNHLLTI